MLKYKYYDDADSDNITETIMTDNVDDENWFRLLVHCVLFQVSLSLYKRFTCLAGSV